MITSRLELPNVSLPLTLADISPPRLPASSPVLVRMHEAASATGWPSIFTLLLPSARSLSIAKFGYASGVGPLGDGVLHTSGGPDACVCPSPACTIVLPLA